MQNRMTKRQTVIQTNEKIFQSSKGIFFLDFYMVKFLFCSRNISRAVSGRREIQSPVTVYLQLDVSGDGMRVSNLVPVILY